jgi:glutamate-1-semialdehyde 2,1-aminomutase
MVDSDIDLILGAFEEFLEAKIQSGKEQAQ